MSLNKVLNSLEKSWERDDILLNIKKGYGTDEIVNEFLVNNESQIKELNSLLRPKDIDLLNQVEQLSNCESKLINEIKNLNYLKNNESSTSSYISTAPISFGNINLILPSRTFLSPISIVRTSSLFILGISVGRS